MTSPSMLRAVRRSRLPGAIRPRVQVIDTYASRNPVWRTHPCKIASISVRLHPGSSRSRVMLAANRSRWPSSR